MLLALFHNINFLAHQGLPLRGSLDQDSERNSAIFPPMNRPESIMLYHATKKKNFKLKTTRINYACLGANYAQNYTKKFDEKYCERCS